MRKYAIVVHRGEIARWYVECVDRLSADKNCELDAIFLSSETTVASPKKARKPAVAVPELQLIDVADLPPVQQIPCETNDEGDLRTVQGTSYFAELEFVLDFTGRVTNVWFTPSYGVWSFLYQRPLACWEILKGESVLRAYLAKFAGQQQLILREGRFKTLSYTATAAVRQIVREFIGWPSAAITAQDIGSLLAPLAICVSEERKWTTIDSLKLAAKAMLYSFKERARRFFCHEQWNLGIVAAPIQDFLSARTVTADWLPCQKNDDFLADPFGLSDDKRGAILCEDFNYRRGHGTIKCLELDEDLHVVRKSTIFDFEPAHLSYPYVFEFDDSIFCVPEMHQLGRIDLYCLSRFPTEWTKLGTILENFAAIDSTLFAFNGLWWLFCTNEERGSNLCLFAFYAPTPKGPWQPHPLNPIKTDICSARPAGTPFIHEGNLFRPSQDCSETYGGAIVVNKIEVLDGTSFREQHFIRIAPIAGPYDKGIHTVAKLGNRCVVDGKRYVFSPGGSLRTLKQYAARWLPLPRKNHTIPHRD